MVVGKHTLVGEIVPVFCVCGVSMVDTKRNLELNERIHLRAFVAHSCEEPLGSARAQRVDTQMDCVLSNGAPPSVFFVSVCAA